MQEITLPNITTKSAGPASGTFTIEPLYPGYGTTVGTALRRVLLSSLPGAAITAIKIAGADHEFTTIKGVKEDAIEIMLNLKQLRFKLDGDEPVNVIVSKKGPGPVVAADIPGTDRLEVVSKDAHIATLADKSALFEAELTIEKGRGYLPVERREEQKLPVGTIAIDAAFTPVQVVNFTVENTRVGQMTNFDRLIMQITTDQTVSPEEAVKEAAQVLVQQFQLFVDPRAKAAAQATAAPAKAAGPEVSIEDADLSSRTTNALINNDLKTMQDVAKLSDAEVADLKGLGAKAVEEVIAKLAELGLRGEAA